MSGPRIAVVGAGVMGARHARVIAEDERCELVTVVDPDPTAGKAVADRYGASWHPDLFIGDIDAVVLASPTPNHYSDAVDLLGAGVPLLVEKPLCDDLNLSADVVELAAIHDVPLMCGLVERFNPAVRTVAALVDAPVHLVATRHSPFPPRVRTGVGWDLLVHDVDIAIRCFGGEPHRVVSGRCNSPAQQEDVLDVVLEFGCGMASVSASRIGQRKVRSLTITESRRVFDVDLLRGSVTVYSGDRVDVPALVTDREPLAAQWDRFLGLVNGSVDQVAERDSILPSHRVVADALSA